MRKSILENRNSMWFEFKNIKESWFYVHNVLEINKNPDSEVSQSSPFFIWNTQGLNNGHWRTSIEHIG